MQFKEKLQKLRKNAGMTQIDLAEKMLVSRQTISKWETGSAIPDIENIIHISDLFNVSLDYLIRDINEPESKSNTQRDFDRNINQKCKKQIYVKTVLIISFILIMILMISYQLHFLATTVVVIIWIILFSGLWCICKRGIALLSKYIQKGEEIHKELILFNESERNKKNEKK